MHSVLGNNFKQWLEGKIESKICSNFQNRKKKYLNASWNRKKKPTIHHVSIYLNIKFWNMFEPLGVIAFIIKRNISFFA